MDDSLAAVVRFFRAVDTHDWETVRAGLAERLTVDYVSLFGGEVETVTADELIGRWQALLPGFDATQHLLGQLAALDGTVQGNVRGYHRLDDEVWMVAGWYVLTLEAGRLAGIVLTSIYETGSRDLVTRAQARASGRAG